MKSIFNQTDRNEIISRIDALGIDNKAQWGKMNVQQMARHCALCEQLYNGTVQVKRSLLGRIFGQMALRQMLKDESPMKPNAPTSKQFIVTDTDGDLQAEKQKWMELIKGYEHYSNDSFVHWFFGKMSREQLGQFIYKHNDHHLRQFSA